MRLSSYKVSKAFFFTFKRLYTAAGNTLWSLSKTLFIFCRHKFSNFARPSYGSLVYSGGFANYFETKLSLGGGICDHTLDVASEHLHVTYFIAAIKINSRSFRMWWSNEFLQLYNTTFDLHIRLKIPLQILCILLCVYENTTWTGKPFFSYLNMRPFISIFSLKLLSFTRIYPHS